jgi:hypothetical protein
MSKRYAREDFDAVPGVPGAHYCPGCNRTPDDYAISSVGCPCDTHGRGGGSLTAIEVARYHRAARMNLDTFSTDNLAVFERHGATVTTRAGRAGCRITLPNKWELSVQWGPGMYGSNYDSNYDSLYIGHEDHLTARQAEIAVIAPRGGLVEWADGDTVQGWCSMERVQHVLDLLASGNLIVDGERPIADDGWVNT